MEKGLKVFNMSQNNIILMSWWCEHIDQLILTEAADDKDLRATCVATYLRVAER